MSKCSQDKTEDFMIDRLLNPWDNGLEVQYYVIALSLNGYDMYSNEY